MTDNGSFALADDNGNGIVIEDCRDAIEFSITEDGATAYTSLGEDETLQLAHEMIFMVMQRRRARGE